MKQILLKILEEIRENKKREEFLEETMKMYFDDFFGISKQHTEFEKSLINLFCVHFDDIELAKDWMEWYLYDVSSNSEGSEVIIDSVSTIIKTDEDFVDFMLTNYALYEVK